MHFTIRSFQFSFSICMSFGIFFLVYSKWPMRISSTKSFCCNSVKSYCRSLTIRSFSCIAALAIYEFFGQLFQEQTRKRHYFCQQYFHASTFKYTCNRLDFGRICVFFKKNVRKQWFSKNYIKNTIKCELSMYLVKKSVSLFFYYYVFAVIIVPIFSFCQVMQRVMVNVQMFILIRSFQKKRLSYCLMCFELEQPKCRKKLAVPYPSFNVDNSSFYPHDDPCTLI